MTVENEHDQKIIREFIEKTEKLSKNFAKGAYLIRKRLNLERKLKDYYGNGTDFHSEFADTLEREAKYLDGQIAVAKMVEEAGGSFTDLIKAADKYVKDYEDSNKTFSESVRYTDIAEAAGTALASLTFDSLDSGNMLEMEGALNGANTFIFGTIEEIAEIAKRDRTNKTISEMAIDLLTDLRELLNRMDLD